jgi:class 3 adenylate cyclase
MERVDYVDTFIAVAEDCSAARGTAPPEKPEKPSVAARTYRMIAERPYEHTSGDVIFAVFADRTGIPEADRAAARLEFYATPRACLRSSDLGKRYGWGIHADVEGRLALYGVETPKYAELASSYALTVTRAMRSTRKKS